MATPIPLFIFGAQDVRWSQRQWKWMKMLHSSKILINVRYYYILIDYPFASYVRTPEDVRAIVKHAKMDERQLTQLTQAIYYPSANVVSDNLRLLELDDHMLQQIRVGQSLHFKGGLHEKVVLCTDETDSTSGFSHFVLMPSVNEYTAMRNFLCFM